MKQTRPLSLIENLVDKTLGYFISVWITYFLLPLLGFHPTIFESHWIGLVYWAASVTRGYGVRRVFNAL